MGRLRQGLTMCQWWRDTGTRRHISEFITWQFTSTKLWRRRTKVNVARILHFIICTLISVVSVSHVHSSPPLCLFAGFVWVVVGGLHRAQGVVDYPVVRLVRPYRQHHVPHGRVILETKSVRICKWSTHTCICADNYDYCDIQNRLYGTIQTYSHPIIFLLFYWEGKDTWLTCSFQYLMATSGALCVSQCFMFPVSMSYKHND